MDNSASLKRIISAAFFSQKICHIYAAKNAKICSQNAGSFWPSGEGVKFFACNRYLVWICKSSQCVYKVCNKAANKMPGSRNTELMYRTEYTVRNESQEDGVDTKYTVFPT